MELQSKFFEQIAFSTRPKIEELMLVVMDQFYTQRAYISTITN